MRGTTDFVADMTAKDSESAAIPDRYGAMGVEGIFRVASYVATCTMVPNG